MGDAVAMCCSMMYISGSFKGGSGPVGRGGTAVFLPKGELGVMKRFENNFPRYVDYSCEVPVWCLTPQADANHIHRFFDTSPLSPSGRYVALTRLPDADGVFPRPGDRARIEVVDTFTGTCRTVWETAGWEYQMGANLNWGASDHELVFNDVDTSGWEPFIVVLDIESGAYRRIAGASVYHVSPDGRSALAADAGAMRRTQGGYGVVLPDERVRYNRGAVADDGVFLTDLVTGTRRLLISIAEVAERVLPPERREEYARSEVYGFHTKWSPTGERLMFSLRYFPDRGGRMFRMMNNDYNSLRYDVYTMRPDGSELFLAIPASEWEKHGHHTNWTPDGRRLTMNLNIDRERMRLCMCGYDGSGLHTIGNYTGSGHPSFLRSGRYGITDCYLFETPFIAPDGSAALRLLDLAEGTERVFTRIRTRTPGFETASDFRLDPHPVWCAGGDLLIFNAMQGGRRRVFAADTRSLNAVPGPDGLK